MSITEVIDGIQNGRLTEAFGAGTAVVLSPFQVIGYNGNDYMLPERAPADSFAVRAKEYMTDLRTGKIADDFGWTYKV